MSAKTEFRLWLAAITKEQTMAKRAKKVSGVLVGMLVLAGSLQAQANMIANPGFEASTATPPVSWTWDQGNNLASAITVSTDDPHSGANSALITVTSSSDAGFAILKQAFSVVGGTEYTESAWVKYENLHGGVVKVEYFNSTGGDAGTSYVGAFGPYFGGSPSNSAWTQVSTTYTVPVAATTAVMSGLANYYQSGPATSGSFGLDDFSFAPVPEPTMMGMLLFGAVGLLRRRRFCTALG